MTDQLTTPSEGARRAYHAEHGKWPSRSWKPEEPSASPSNTPEAAVWDDRGYMRWTLETCGFGSRLSHSRNYPNPR